MFATIIRRYILFLVFVYRTNGAFVGKIPERVHVQRCSAPLSTSTDLQVDPKEAVKVFGRMAEKYIMLDASAGKCCYSGCSNCEYRLPGGGYRMADQSAARPKWIPCYDVREGAENKVHNSKWSNEIFVDGSTSVTKSEFIERVVAMDYAPTLGGPYTTVSNAGIDDVAAVAALFDLLIQQDGDSISEDRPLTKFYMSKRLKEMAGEGQEGLTWQSFITIFD